MKPFQAYFTESTKVYQFRIKMGGTEPTGEVLTRIKNALDTYQLESVSTPKRLPIQEHREFPKWGPCECWFFDVGIKYPTTTAQMHQTVATRAMLDPTWMTVKTLDQALQEEAVQERINSQGPVLSDPEYKTEPQGDIAGQGRVTSLFKELSARTYEFAAKSDADGKTTNDLPTNNKSVLKPNTTPRGK